jgi:ribosomal protein S27AE
METMNNSLLLNIMSKEVDNIICEKCGKGVIVPEHPDSKVNHSFYCNNCGIHIYLEPNVIVE